MLGVVWRILMCMPERDKKLDAIYQMVRQNNKMLRGMRRAAFWGTIFKLLFYAALLGIPVYLYFTIFQPILNDLLSTYAQIQQAGNQLQGVGNQLQGVTDGLPLEQLEGLLKNIPGVDFSGTSQ